MTFEETIELAGKTLDGIGVVIVVVGVAFALGAFAIGAVGGGEVGRAYRSSRHRLGRAILLGLEVLVAADIVRTVAIAPTIESVAVLAGIVLVRTFLSFSLEVELEGSLPWRRRRDGSADAVDPGGPAR